MPHVLQPKTPRKTNRYARSAPFTADRLAVLQDAFQELAQCQSLDEIKDIRDKAEAVRQYARNAKAGLEMQNKAAELKLRAERRAGELLKAMNLRGGDRVSDSHNKRLTLKQLDISQNQSTRWQKVASVPEEDFRNLVKVAGQGECELSTASLLKLANARVRNRATSLCKRTPPLDGSRSRQPKRHSSPERMVEELLNHHQVLDSILNPLYDGGDAPVLLAGQGRHLRRLVRECKSLLADLQTSLPIVEGK